MFNVIIREYVEKELEQIFASVIKPGTFDTNLNSKDKVYHLYSWKHTQRRYIERESCLCYETAAFAANFGF